MEHGKNLVELLTIEIAIDWKSEFQDSNIYSYVEIFSYV